MLTSKKKLGLKRKHIKIMKKILVLFIVSTVLYACSKKDDETVDPIPQTRDLNGGYVVVEGSSNGYSKAYIVDSKIYFLGKVDRYDSRAMYNLAYEMVSDTELNIYTFRFSVSWEGDKLTLTEIGGTQKMVFIAESSTPLPSEWVITVDPVSKIDQSTFTNGRIADMTYYRGFVYTHGHRDLNDEYAISKINTTDFSLTNIPLINESATLALAANIEHVGSDKFWLYYWGNPQDYMYEFNADTLARTDEHLMPYQTGNAYHLGSNGTDLYGAFNQSIRKWSFVDQTWGSEIEFGFVNSTDGLDLSATHLYLGSGSIIQKYDLDTFKAVAAYNVSMGGKYQLNGFTLTNNSTMVASMRNVETDTYEIVSITLPN